MQHTWVPSTLGHGETMCSRCFTTNREAAALGIMDQCDAPPPKPANDTGQHFTQEQIDDEVFGYSDSDDGPEPGEECGRWSNNRLTEYCSKAGSEECDWECPYRGR